MTVAHRIGVPFGEHMQLWWDLPAAESLAELRDLTSGGGRPRYVQP
jgi:viologen exporter family transport system ATP-binding protein